MVSIRSLETLLGFARTGASATGASASDTDWGVAIGGGLDHSLGVRWSIRGLAQLRLIRGEGTVDTDPRLSIGFVYRLRL